VAGTLSSHDVPDADVSQPARPAKLVFFDSTDLHWCPDVGQSYVPQGTQVRVPSQGLANPWYALFGSLEYPTGAGLYTMHQRKRHQEVRAHLEGLLERDPDAFWIVVLDSASAHTTPKLKAFLTEHGDRLGLVFQPTYSPHLNLIERLWRLMRGQMTRNQFYHSLKELAEAVVKWLEKLPFAKFCSLMGIDEEQVLFIQ
jgi:transposase